MTDRDQRVYFARCRDWIKVGTSIQAEVRIRQVNPKWHHLCPPGMTPDDRLELLGSIPGGADVEADILATLWEWRIVGEWVEATDFVLDFIAEQLRSAA